MSNIVSIFNITNFYLCISTFRMKEGSVRERKTGRG